MAKPPAFQFYPKDFLGSMSVSLMSAEQIGAYILLLCFNWSSGGIPSDRVAIATLCRVPKSTLDSWGETNEQNIVLRHFVKDETTGLLVNERLEAERLGQIERREKAKKSGIMGAASRWEGKNGKRHSERHPNAIANAKETLWRNDGSSSSSTSTVQKKKLSKKEDFLFSTKKFSQKFSDTWAEWVETRMTKTKPKDWKPFFERQFKKLHEYTESNAINILTNSTLNGYQGLFWDRYPTGDQPTASNGARPAPEAKPKSVWSIKEQLTQLEEQIRDVKEWDRKHDHISGKYYFEDPAKEKLFNELIQKRKNLKLEMTSV